MYDYTESVRRGIEFLDKHAPAGWRDRIDWSKVSIMSADDCIAGQAFGPSVDDEGYRISGWTQASDIIWNSYVTQETDDFNTGDFGFNYAYDDEMCNHENLVNTWKRELGVKS